MDRLHAHNGVASEGGRIVIFNWWELASVGGLGALALEAANVALYVQRTGHVPWRSRDYGRRADRDGHALPRLPIFGVAIVLKTLTGLVLVGALAAGGQVDSALTALLLGSASTNLLLRASQQVSLPDGSVPAGSTLGQSPTADRPPASLAPVGPTGAQVVRP